MKGVKETHIFMVTAAVALSFILGSGMMLYHLKRGEQTRIGIAYGCGRHDEMRTAQSDALDYEWPPCIEARKLWGEAAK